jgi:hypothetical protein
MEEAVRTARLQASDTQSKIDPESSPISPEKSKLLEECTDYACIGTGGWGAWVCSM